MSLDRFNSILLCVDVAAKDFDGGPTSDVLSAIAETNWVRKHSGATVTLMAVVEGEEVDADTLDLARHRLEETVLPKLDEPAMVVVAHGTAFVEIIRQAMRASHDLVMVAPSSSNLVHRTLVGSVSMHVLRKCPCPVWVSPRKSDTGPRVVLSAIALHDLSATVAELSATVVKLRGGQWHVFHCPEYPNEGGMRLRGASVQETEEYEAVVRKKAWEALHTLCDPLGEQTGVEPKFWMSEGVPSEQIALATRELSADMLVLGTVGRTGLAGHIIGNTAEKLLNNVECSILAVKPEGFVSPVKLDD